MSNLVIKSEKITIKGYYQGFMKWLEKGQNGVKMVFLGKRAKKAKKGKKW